MAPLAPRSITVRCKVCDAPMSLNGYNYTFGWLARDAWVLFLFFCCFFGASFALFCDDL